MNNQTYIVHNPLALPSSEQCYPCIRTAFRRFALNSSFPIDVNKTTWECLHPDQQIHSCQAISRGMTSSLLNFEGVWNEQRVMRSCKAMFAYQDPIVTGLEEHAKVHGYGRDNDREGSRVKPIPLESYTFRHRFQRHTEHTTYNEPLHRPNRLYADPWGKLNIDPYPLLPLPRHIPKTSSLDSPYISIEEEEEVDFKKFIIPYAQSLPRKTIHPATIHQQRPAPNQTDTKVLSHSSERRDESNYGSSVYAQDGYQQNMMITLVNCKSERREYLNNSASRKLRYPTRDVRNYTKQGDVEVHYHDPEEKLCDDDLYLEYLEARAQQKDSQTLDERLEGECDELLERELKAFLGK